RERERESWFYKNHPNGLYRPSHQVLNHLCPNIQSIDAHIPFELLLIAGFEPAKVSGYSSSLFFNQSHTQIGIYIPRVNDPYVSILEIEKDLKEEQILTFEKQKKELQESQVFELVYDPEKNQSHWYLKTDNKTLLNIFTNKKLKIIEETENKIVIETNENGKKIQTYIQKDFYRYILLNTEKKP
ncbi:MAG: hypothetical protein J6V53_00390, partial [Alphaproteobacteria bacterium]|nr:hypothetical protein [Alphaproteobacteria bacterium]